jgi:hypothetical protein
MDNPRTPMPACKVISSVWMNTTRASGRVRITISGSASKSQQVVSTPLSQLHAAVSSHRSRPCNCMMEICTVGHRQGGCRFAEPQIINLERPV